MPVRAHVQGNPAMLKKLSTCAASLVLAAAITVTGLDSAEAGRRHRGAMIGGAALGLFVLGATGARAWDRGQRCYRCFRP